MAENKKSFIVYAEWIETFNDLDDDEAGRLIKHIFKYVNDMNPEAPDKLTKHCFIPIKQSLKRDLNKWDEIREKRSIAGKASAEKRKQNATNPTHVESVEHNSTNPTVNVNVNGNVNEINNKYIYSKFYDNQLELSNNDISYTKLVKFLFGENELKTKFNGVLSITDQLTFEQFKKIIEVTKANKLKLRELLAKMENDKKYYKGKKSLYLTLNNWAKGTFV